MKAAAFDAAAVATVAALLLWPAFYNGYALLYPDSTLYVGLSFAPQELTPRSLAYALFMLPLHFGTTVWTLIAAQSLLVAWVLHEAVAVFVVRHRISGLLALGVGLAVLTGLPWTVSQVMPDFLTGLLVLALVLLILFPERLPLPRRAILLAIVVLAVAVHASHMLLAIAVLAIDAVVLWWSKQKLRLMLAPCGAVIVGVALTVAINLAIAGQAYYSKGGEQFLFGRLVDDGLIAAHLEQACPNPELKLCGLKEDLPRSHNEYLWGDGEAFSVLGGWDGSRELRRIMWDSVKSMPWRHLAAIVRDTARQAISQRAGDSLHHPSPAAMSIIEIAFPGDAITFHGAIQQRASLRPLLDVINSFQVPAQLAAMAALMVLAGFWAWRDQRRVAGFCVLILTALLANAFVCGTFSGTLDRYQSRVAWIAVLAVMAVAMQQWHCASVKRQTIEPS